MPKAHDSRSHGRERAGRFADLQRRGRQRRLARRYERYRAEMRRTAERAQRGGETTRPLFRFSDRDLWRALTGEEPRHRTTRYGERPRRRRRR